MSEVTDLDIDRVVPHVDLVLFDNVLSCYPWNKDITVNYTLGLAVRATTWDWIGIFPTDWRYLGEYVAYSWAPSATDITNPRRRGLVFPSGSHKIQANDEDWYNFLYIAHGNHVVGVSAAFRVTDEEVIEKLYIERLFSSRQHCSVPQQESTSSDPDPPFNQLTCSGFYDSYEIVDETIKPDSGAIPKRKASNKRKVTKVYRDTTTLVGNVHAYSEKLRIVDVHPIVQEYIDNKLKPIVVTPPQKEVPVYDIQWKNKPAKEDALEIVKQHPCKNYIPAIEYPDILSVTAGPESFMVGVNSSSRPCTNCYIAKTLVKDLLDKDENKKKRLIDLENEINNLRSHTNEKTNTTSRIDKEATVGILDWCLEQIQDDNRILRMRINDLEGLLMDERAKNAAASVKTKKSSASVMTQESSTSVKTQTVNTDISAVSLATPYVNNADGWFFKEPKRIERLRKAHARQSRNIHLLHETISVKDLEINNLKEENSKLRRMLKNEKDQTHVFCTLADELNIRIKAVLAERAKDRTNEWRSFVRQVECSPCPTPFPTPCPSNNSSEEEATAKSADLTKKDPKPHKKNKHMPKALKSEKHGLSKPNKEKSETEECPTCGLQFSLKTDKRVIEKHMQFHRR